MSLPRTASLAASSEICTGSDRDSPALHARHRLAEIARSGRRGKLSTAASRTIPRAMLADDALAVQQA